jgi:DNA-binding transcriptional ArsR family regulator
MKYNCVNCFRSLGAKKRFKIFFHLRENKNKSKNGINIKSLVKLTSLRQPTVTFHINKLVKQGLVKKKKAGREVYCQIHKKCDDCPLFK